VQPLQRQGLAYIDQQENVVFITVRSLIFEGEEELMPDCVRFQGDCGDPKIITV
jgi:hypothetical protein